jgi:hypothetical protein
MMFVPERLIGKIVVWGDVKTRSTEKHNLKSSAENLRKGAESLTYGSEIILGSDYID